MKTLICSFICTQLIIFQDYELNKKLWMVYEVLNINLKCILPYIMIFDTGQMFAYTMHLNSLWKNQL